MLNQIIIAGNVVEDIELKETSNQTHYANLVIKVKREYRNSQGNYDEDVFSVLLWRSVADQCIMNCKKDDLVAIKGRVQSNVYNREDGTTFYNYEIIADKVMVLEK